METKRFGRNVLTVIVILLGSIFGLSLSTWFLEYNFNVSLETNPVYESGYCYHANIPRLPDSLSWIVRPDYGIEFLEDNVRLGPKETGYEPVIDEGNGRYYVQEKRVIYLSASDNSDPRNNGRYYSVRLIPIAVSLPVVFGQFLLLSFSVLVVFLHYGFARRLETGGATEAKPIEPKRPWPYIPPSGVIRTITIQVAIVAVVLLLLEGIAQLYSLRNPVRSPWSEYIIPDNLLHHRFAPNYVFFDDRRNPGYMFRSNAQSWMEEYVVHRKPANNIFRIFYLGDSNTQRTVDYGAKWLI